ncbi:MAG: ParB/RepB/Spo0J family partition protein [Deltaproteobacteria bacterium]|nr:ParB/RepB/Spo0J family partition protein [Deltaproteobacteria bacterium]
MGTHKALGRGLSALIPPAAPIAPSTPEPDTGSGTPLYIAVSRIAPNPRQPRKSFNDGELMALAASIREQGVLQPLVVRHKGDDYELIIGERRWRACQLAGVEEVPAVVLDASDRGVLEMALVENVQRADLNAVELANAFRALIDSEGMTQEEVGRRVGLDRSSIANHLRMLELGTNIQQDLIDQKLTMGHAKAILQVPRSERNALHEQILKGGLTVRAAEELARRDASNAASKTSRPGPSRDVHVVDLEDQLCRALQTKVRIVGRRVRGRIELHYFGAEELDRLSDRLRGSG